jgi:hypothetical protein
VNEFEINIMNKNYEKGARTLKGANINGTSVLAFMFLVQIFS